MFGRDKIGSRPWLFVATLLATIVLASPAYAYIDPGAGSLILQALAAIGVGLLFYIRRITDTVKRLLGIKSSRDDDKSNVEERTDQ